MSVFFILSSMFARAHHGAHTLCSLSSCRPSRGLRRRKQHGHHGGHGHIACRPTAAHCHPRYHLQDRRSVPADRIAIVTSGKFGLWSTMSIFELNQAHLFWFIAECFWIRWARAGHRVSGRGDHGARRQRQRRQRERAGCSRWASLGRCSRARGAAWSRRGHSGLFQEVPGPLLCAARPGMEMAD